MKIEFDPLNAGDRDLVGAICALAAGGAIANVTEFATAIADVTEVSVVQNPVATGEDAAQVQIVQTEATEQPTADATGAGETDKHGMTHNPEIHSSPPKKTAKGEWQARRNRGAELKAAIEAHKSGKTAATGAAMTAPVEQQQAATTQPVATQEPADPLQPKSQTMPSPGATMPTPTQPATQTPNTPPPAVDYEAMAERFMSMIDASNVSFNRILDYEVLYAELAIVHATLENDQAAMRRLVMYMDQRDAQVPHEHAVQATLQALPVAQ